MRVIEHLNQAKDTIISFEVLPPLKGRTINSIYDHLDPLMEFKPSWINVTYHRSESMFKKKKDGTFEKVEVRKRPGTVGICAAIMNHYKIDAVPHFICGGFTKRETEDALIDLNFLGVDNVLVLRGDAPKNETAFEPEPEGHRLAIDLLKQVSQLNNGLYLDEDILNGGKTNFCIGVAGYPEKHFEAPNLEIDLQRLKDKVDAGATYIMTQMFFDNQKFYDFVKACRDIGIDVPVIPGLKPITNKKQLSVLPRIFHVDIPSDLSNAIMRAADEMHEDEPETVTLKNRFFNIATAKVATSGFEGYQLGILRKGLDEIVMNQGRRIAEAKKSVIEIYDQGYVTPQQRKDIRVMGRSALGALYAGINGMWKANYATEHDALVARKLAYVMCGGDLSEPTLVSEQYLLDLERQAFLSLCGERKTLERIQSVLKSGKPIRN